MLMENVLTKQARLLDLQKITVIHHKLLHCMLNLKINTTSMLPQKNVVQLLDPLSPNSDQDHFSPNNTHTFLSEKLMRVTVKLRK